jgi:hypothetical protein
MPDTIDVHVSGVVVGKWQYQGDMFLRVLSRRQRNVPYPDDKKFDAFTVRLNYFLRQDEELEIPDKHDVVHVTGFLQQRDNQVTLASLLRHKLQQEDSDPQALEHMYGLDGAAHRIRFREDVVEIVALDWDVHRKNKRRRKKKPVKKPKQSTVDEVQDEPLTGAKKQVTVQTQDTKTQREQPEESAEDQEEPAEVEDAE